ncbi:MAG: TetR/AcrR family transcriptional regulator [Brevundimonas sp.]|uniref:TetR/AcrR family transcriptional regulator n=1 Tax=Brevundimonas sp. TaxID=1871086 RepID=UPI00272273A6|nr:TetR/AcrR family transcriptional regulator [Brevundimonas sp.]MDO9589238.1 TetR/AcrR family transcriptional regulator [Brevundimonas sp.]MDP2764802.1 TetR/AcrR family transcriptional regulator [Brevundimonas sp.]MDP3368714.1 TetR/AcrR family transcriptional regulator [Brevundimonas sp.]MDP3655456.1 TetR/AcrR family transcriptional regulator [Brevundimonas sp.]MDZ4111497.1 TetR/AcrR family transcriptional regulator [Brevundimonas sp.]
MNPSPNAESEGETPRLNRRQAAKVRTRQKVLDAARTLFAERGYEPATIRDIAKGAGMSTGAVFANFQDKAELFEAVLSEDMAKLAETLRTAAAAETSLRARLLSALTAGYHGSLEQLPLVQAVVARSWFQPIASEMRVRAAVKPLVMVVSDALQAGVREGELRQDADVRLLSELIYDAWLSNYRRAAYDGWTIQQLTTQIGKQIDAILAGQLSRQ